MTTQDPKEADRELLDWLDNWFREYDREDAYFEYPLKEPLERIVKFARRARLEALNDMAKLYCQCEELSASAKVTDVLCAIHERISQLETEKG